MKAKLHLKLPVGVNYTVEESDNVGYTVTVNGTTDTSATGIIQAGETSKAEFNNNKPGDSPEPGPGPAPNPDPEPPTTDPEKPPVEITDPDVPLVEPEDPTTEIDESDVPLVEPGTPVEPPVEEIDEPEVPLGDAPKTGDAAPIVGLVGLLIAAVAGLVVTRRKFN